ncbi:MAG TPA: hypothetical protein VNB29_05935, partial [Chthoniobacterales bacterium]|nr:hypothetical protein [Chthoniobacterales bacterium]
QERNVFLELVFAGLPLGLAPGDLPLDFQAFTPARGTKVAPLPDGGFFDLEGYFLIFGREDGAPMAARALVLDVPIHGWMPEVAV